jgi:MFS family permease
LSLILVGLSFYIRLRLKESPLFEKLKASGKASTAPVRDSLGSGKNWRLMAIALFGATAGQGVVWYTGQFYALYFLQTQLKIDFLTSNIVISVALLLGAPFFVVFGKLSDRIGRKRVMLVGNILAVLTYIPIYAMMVEFSKPPNVPVLVALVFVQVLYVTMVYGPIAAFLVELFPAKIRYTSLSLPYHIGNGVFGGLTPLIGTAIVATTGSMYAGLFYPMTVALITVIVSLIWVPETRHVSIWDEVEAGHVAKAE